MKSKFNGYTLYEMAVVLSIVGILLSIALPMASRQVLIHNNENSYVQLKSTVKLAQEEAIRRNTNNIIICSAIFNKNDVLYNDTCHRTDGVWTRGIIAFVDLLGSGVYNGTSSEERINAVRFESGVAVTTNVNRLRVNSDGVLSDDAGRSQWLFKLSQTKFGITYCRTTSLNRYGYFTDLLDNCQ